MPTHTASDSLIFPPPPFMAEIKENVLIFPFMAQGHIIPFLALALHIERTKGYAITFVNTPQNINKIRSSLPPSSAIRLLEIPFCSSDHGLPPDCENTDVLPYHLIIRLLHASTSLKSPFRKLISDLIDENHGRRPICVIADIFFGWTAGVARELCVFHAIFSGASGYGLACYYSNWINLPHRKENSDEFLLPDFSEASRIHVTQLALNILQADGTDDWSLFQRENLPAWKNSSAILFNTVEEIDQTGLLYFRRKLNRPVWSIGPILLPQESRDRIGKNGLSQTNCIEWLDSKPENSVLFISFGSQNTISLSQMIQLAKALEISQKNFIWVVRPPLGFDINSDFEGGEWLPKGFENRISESRKGLLIQKWAPQEEILSHRSISAFLTHCGWNSVLEGLSHGVPLLGWPMAGEQFFNAKMLQDEIGVCVEFVRGLRCEVKCQDLAKKIEMVIGETEKGKNMRQKALEIKGLIKNAMKDEDGFKGSSANGMDEFFRAAMAQQRGLDLNLLIGHSNDIKMS